MRVEIDDELLDESHDYFCMLRLRVLTDNTPNTWRSFDDGWKHMRAHLKERAEEKVRCA